MNNQLHIETKILIRTAIRQLTICLDILNKIDDKDTILIVRKITVQKRHIKHVLDNIARGNVWIALFYLREILEQILLADDF